MKGAALAALCVFATWTGLARADLPEPVAQALAQAGIPESHIGLAVYTLAGTPLLEHGADRAFNPASVMKVVTTLAALDTWGPAHTFQTRVWLDGSLQDGVLEGQMVLQGGGDPGMTPERFWLLLRELRQRGIREIRGDVVLDNSLYAIEAQDPGAFDQAPLRPYNAQPAALLVNYNAQLLRLGPGVDKVDARLDPAPSETRAASRLDNRLQLNGLPCNGWLDRLFYRPEGSRLVLEGEYPAACGEKTLALNLDPPQATAGAWFSALWRELGGVHAGQVVEGPPGPAATLYLEFDSRPLSELVRDVNKYSNNVMAKMLFLNLGVHQQGGAATWEKGEQVLRAWLASRGQPLPKLVLQNGSGLSRLERLSAGGLARLLAWAASRPAYFEFAASLPAVGLEGTQRRRFNGGPEQPLQGRAWLKSGSLNGSRSLAGYVLGPEGERRILVLFINHPRASRAEGFQEAVLSWVAYTKIQDSGTPETVNQQ
ncbi:MAG: D-alanyl-D-alanine carboxypeptidase/D-alanyl-D-alanine-endopeptidase [Pseudomonadota bacterium]